VTAEPTEEGEAVCNTVSYMLLLAIVVEVVIADPAMVGDVVLRLKEGEAVCSPVSVSVAVGCAVLALVLVPLVEVVELVVPVPVVPVPV
jgi:uncharacterized phosphosugar-binding protein